MGGFECSDQLNCFGYRVDLLGDTAHPDFIQQDYSSLRQLGVHTVREGLQWSRVEQKLGCYDWSRMVLIAEAAQSMDIQVIWDLCHFGYPDDLTPLHPLFCERFVAYALAFVEAYRAVQPLGWLILTPINEVSFISWLGGEEAATSPYTKSYGWEVKYALARAYIAAVKALKRADTAVVVMSTEPLIHIVADDEDDEQMLADVVQKNEEQYQIMDILMGNICPELGGNPEMVDVVGLNFYPNNQWCYPSGQQLDWKQISNSDKVKSLRELCRQTYNRYPKPFVIAETSLEGGDKTLWLQYMDTELRALLREGLPLWGCCIYPVLNRPDWDFPERWHDSGIWSVDAQTKTRAIQQPYADIIRSLTRCGEYQGQFEQLPLVKIPFCAE